MISVGASDNKYRYIRCPMMTNAALFLFIGKSLAMDGNPSVREEVVAAVSGGRVPWEAFVWTGSSHYVLPALWSAYERNGIAPLIPEELAEHMAAIYALNAVRSRRITEQCQRIHERLASAGMHPLFFKGAALLMMGLFRDSGDRMMEDIDLLLPEAEIPGAVDLLLKEGYLRHPVDEEKKVVYTDHHHLPPMYHPREVTTLEIHRYPVHEDFRKYLAAEEVIREAVPAGSAGMVYSHSPDDHPGSIPGKITGRHNSCQAQGEDGVPLFVACPRHAMTLVFLHEHRTGSGYLSSSGTLKGALDFYLLSRLRPPEPGDLPHGKLRNKYLRYARAVQKIMGVAPDIPATEASQNPFKAGLGAREEANSPAGVSLINKQLPSESGVQFGPAREITGRKCRELWWRKELFLLDHPGIDHFWFEFLYTPAVFMVLLVRSVWSPADRQLVKSKLRKKLKIRAARQRGI